MKILTFGGNGFIGTSFKKLIEEITLYTPHWTNDYEITNSRTDVTKEEKVKKTIKKYNPDVIINFAGILKKDSGQETRQQCHNVHVKGTANILKHAYLQKSVKKVVLFGSTDEETFYGKSKRDMENYASFQSLLYEEKGKQVIIIKPSIVYGPGQEGTMLIPAMIKSIKEGKVFYMSKGDQKRDFVYVDDVSRLVKKVISCEKDLNGETLNCGWGKSYKVKRVPKIVKKMTPSFEYSLNKKKRKNEPKNRKMNIKKTTKLTGWGPIIDLKDGLTITLKEEGVIV